MKLLVCGSRDYDNPQRMVEMLGELLEEFRFDTVIHGDASGADRMGGSWGTSLGLRVVPYPANWKKYSKPAGPIRNRQMLEEGKPDIVAAFTIRPLSTSKGTLDMVTISLDAGLPVYVTRIL